MRRGIVLAPAGSFVVSTNALPITVYWRPGCWSCERLRRAMRAAGVEAHEVNIWQDPQAAAVVRLVADGNETVPTVTVGSTVLVDPSIRSVLAEIHRQVPSRTRLAGVVPDRARGAGRTLTIVQWASVAGLIGLSLLAEGLGHVALSWGIDGLNVALYLVVRRLRAR